MTETTSAILTFLPASSMDVQQEIADDAVNETQQNRILQSAGFNSSLPPFVHAGLACNPHLQLTVKISHLDGTAWRN